MFAKKSDPVECLRRQLASLHVQYDWDTLFGESSGQSTPDTTPNKGKKSKSRKLPQETPQKSMKQFVKRRDELTTQYYHEFNRRAFQSKLPVDLAITWSKRMTKTAGFTKMKSRLMSPVPRVATIELSMKVIDSEDRLRETLLHEMCHVAAFLIDGVTKPPHGDCFWKWARIAEKGMKDEIKVTTCHSYEINRPFKFTCTNKSCAKVYGRHSKKGIDVSRQFCGICHSMLEFSGKLNPDGTPQKARAASAFSLFVKEHYGSVKAGAAKEFRHCDTSSSLSHGDVMKVLSKMYAEERQRADPSVEGVAQHLFNCKD